MIKREDRNSEIARRKARRQRTLEIENKVNDIMKNTENRNLIDFVDRGALEDVERMCNEESANSNCLGSRGLTPLHMAGFASISEVLLNNGAQINVKSCDKSSGENYGGGDFTLGGQTPLHYSAYSGQLGVVRVLLQNKAHCRITNDSGKQPVQVASERQYPKITRILTNPEEFLAREQREKAEAEAAEAAEMLKAEKEAHRARVRKEARLRQRIEAHARKVSSEKSRVADDLLKSEKELVPIEVAYKVNPPSRLPS
mmetsp:Transcript_32051/g.41201  ORF Transcript_32051/g.41201 Transcript_32051/m.41201 type:complete len:257 (+) Transcript_32051:132-902(+)